MGSRNRFVSGSLDVRATKRTSVTIIAVKLITIIITSTTTVIMIIIHSYPYYYYMFATTHGAPRARKDLEDLQNPQPGHGGGLDPRRGASSATGYGQSPYAEMVPVLRFADSNFPGGFHVDMRTPPLNTKILLESSPLKSRI